MLQAELRVIGGAQDGQVIRLKPGKFLIGREPDCHLRPKSELVSRHHCAFTADEFALRLRDLGSTNGTFVNDERIRGQVLLANGDRVRAGNLEFEVQLVQEPETATPVEDTLAFAALDTLVDKPPSRPGEQRPGIGETTIIGDLSRTGSGGAPTEQLPEPAPDEDFVVQQEFVAAPRAPVVVPAGPSAQPVRRPAGGIAPPPLKLPDPSETGVKSTEPPSAAAPTGTGDPEEKPADRAAEIIRRFRHRRPT